MGSSGRFAENQVSDNVKRRGPSEPGTKVVPSMNISITIKISKTSMIVG